MEAESEHKPMNDRIEALQRTLEWVAPFLKPTIIVLLGVCVLALVVFGWFAWLHLPWGNHQLNMDNTGNMGQFIGGIAGTAFAAISSLLLVATILVQVKEYNLTHQELQKSVQAQEEMAQAQQAQLIALQEQASAARQLTNMDAITRSVEELKKEITYFSGAPFNDAKGCMPVITSLVATWNHETGWLHYIVKGEDENRKQEMIGYTARTLLELELVVERATLLAKELELQDLPESWRIVQHKRLVRLVKHDLVDLVRPLSELRGKLHQVPQHTFYYTRFRTQAIERVQWIEEELMKFFRAQLSQFSN